ncbi:MAG: hypothetical protein M1823_000602 [Watsoniomyces obsoletus]|nr:MAG: hypothetical protein M1823_000602 [Watsoniomyces obsoletus]
MSNLFGSAANSAANNSSSIGDISKDVPLVSPPDDSISDLAFSPESQHLAVGSWDKKVRIYEVNNQGNSEGKAMFEHEGPVLSVHWSRVIIPCPIFHPILNLPPLIYISANPYRYYQDGSKVVGGGADKAARMIDLAGGNATTQVAQHDNTIRIVRFIDLPNSNAPMVVTASWDKTVKYWDLRSPNAVCTVATQDRVYAMDVRGQLLVIGTADRYVDIINLNKPDVFYKAQQSPLKWQTRVISCFPDGSGYAMGSIEGRCAIQYVEDKDASLNFSFKCHREQPTNQRDIANVYSVNAISFHPVHGTFSTAGSDGTFHFWDKDAKHRLKGYPNVGGAITSTSFNRTGDIFAYAISYDWSKGYAHYNPTYPNKVMLHAVGGEECKPRQQPPRRR